MLGLNVILITNFSVSFAEENNIDELPLTKAIEQAKDSSKDSQNYMLKLSAENDGLVEELKKLRDLNTQTIEEAEVRQKRILEISTILKQQNKFLKLIDDDFKAYSKNADKYIFTTNGKKYVPYLYMLAALSISKDNIESKLLYGLAGYGGGALIENSGYGLTGLTAYIKFDLLEW